MNSGGIHTVLRRSRRVVLASVVALAAGTALSAAPANAEGSTPGCGQTLASGVSWLSGGGVAVRGNGSSTGTDVSCAGGARFQSVELAERLWRTRGWMPKAGANHLNAATLYSQAEARTYGLRAVPNGAISAARFKPGDAVVWSGGSGHVAVITTVSGSGRNLRLGIAEQNRATPGKVTGDWGTDTLYVRGGTFLGNRSQDVLGIVHPQGNRFDATRAYSFHNIGDGYAIDLEGGQAALGAEVVRQNASDARSQRFYLVPASKGRYLVASVLNPRRVLQTLDPANEPAHGGMLVLGTRYAEPVGQEFQVDYNKSNRSWTLWLPPWDPQSVQPYCIRSNWRLDGPGWQLDTGGCPGLYADWTMRP